MRPDCPSPAHCAQCHDKLVHCWLNPWQRRLTKIALWKKLDQALRAKGRSQILEFFHPKVVA
jgi:hypothetical protein